MILPHDSNSRRAAANLAPEAVGPLIREGLASEASEMTDEDWEDIAREGTALIAPKQECGPNSRI
jgi:hypothetical protein